MHFSRRNFLGLLGAAGAARLPLIGAPEAKEGFSNIYAAMPSLHIGWSSWCAFALVPVLRRRWLKGVAGVYPFVTLFAIAVTANHWILDGVGGLVWLTAGYGVARLWERIRREEASPPSPTSPR